ncbi:monocarboxylate transporter 9-like [Musca domestica]|uniref:Monocarboxylate transporter 9-like n=1 Tax=Musca domestica TaxID=7370 RepID=A0ABM3VJ79_MUSDO|nr:monocarboxylate transporter 9-like [Musca domestica]
MTEEKSKLSDANNTLVYKPTTLPNKSKSKHRDKSDLGANFVAPDGGWGWVVCIAAGFSNLSIFPPLQQYGLIYRQRMENSKFDAQQITTIINAEMALSAIIGLVNGAMFRRFTFRQVGMVGSLLAFTGIFCTAFCENFIEYLVCFSSIYGIGRGLITASNSLAVNTYFKNKRRRATGFTWTITGLGAVIFPHVSTLLLGVYGAQGSILIYSAIMLNAFMCSLTLQPVLWHSPKPDAAEAVAEQEHGKDNEIPIKCEYCLKREKEEQEEQLEKSEYEITVPGTPMVARANDGWFGSKLSLNKETRPSHNRRCQVSQQNSCESGYELEERKSSEKQYGPQSLHCTCAEKKALLEQNSKNKQEEEKEAQRKALLQEEEEQETLRRRHLSVAQKIILFFDLDLLKDFTFVNLAVGMTIMMFGEVNFSVLTPFILNSFGYNDAQISVAMSCLAGMDIGVRFLAPLLLERVKLSNSVLFAFGIVAVSIGRFIVTQTDSYHVVLAVFVLIGFGKGFRTIFSPLIIPSCVPLKRLPAAAGLQLIFSSIVSFSLGPLLGSITDRFGYAVTIHCINALTGLMLLFWIFESFIRKSFKKKSPTSDS